MMAQPKFVADSFVSSLYEKSSMSVDLITSLIIKLGKEKCMDAGEFLVEAGVLIPDERYEQPDRKVVGAYQQDIKQSPAATDDIGLTPTLEMESRPNDNDSATKKDGENAQIIKKPAQGRPNDERKEVAGCDITKPRRVASEGSGDMTAAEMNSLCHAAGEAERSVIPRASSYHGQLSYNPHHYQLIPVRHPEGSYHGGAGDYLPIYPSYTGMIKPRGRVGRGRGYPRRGDYRGSSREVHSNSNGINSNSSAGFGGQEMYGYDEMKSYGAGRGRAAVRGSARGVATGYRGGKGAPPTPAGFVQIPRVMAFPAPNYYGYKRY